MCICNNFAPQTSSCRAACFPCYYSLRLIKWNTLLNKLNPDWNLDTGEVSTALGRGRHTTRVVELFEIENGKVLDTPGFSALDFYEYSNEQIRDGFIEFSDYPGIYKDCMHTNEGEGKVKIAVNDNNIMKSRYENYLKFIERKW